MLTHTLSISTRRGPLTLDVRILQRVDELEDFEREIVSGVYFGYDTEGTGLKPQLGARICGHCFATVTAEGRWIAWYIPVRHVGDHNEGKNLDPFEVACVVQRVLGRTGVTCAMTHAKFDIAMARGDNIRTQCSVIDVSILATIDNENEPAFGLKPLAVKYCAPDAAAESAKNDAWMKADARALKLCFKKRSKKTPSTPTYLETYGYSRSPVELLGRYGALDAFFTLWLWLNKYNSVWERFPEVTEREHALIWELHEMEWRGLPLDIDEVHSARNVIETELHDLTQTCKSNFGDDFQLTPAYMKKLFYERMALPIPKETKTGGESTDKEARLLLAARHPEYADQIKVINRAASFEKIRNTYAESFEKAYDAKSQRLYPVYNQLEKREEGGVPKTGRLSSADPNIQNIAKAPLHLGHCTCKDCRPDLDLSDEDRDEATVSVRRYFTVPGGYIRAYIDFSQIELRVLAWFSRDPHLLFCYANDYDVHSMTADDVTGGDRHTAKQVNFGNSYGMTEIGLAKRMKGYYEDPEGTRERAKHVLAAFFQKYAGIGRFRDNFAAEMRRNGGMFVSPFGRPRRIPEIASPKRWERERAARKMMSSIISGTAADLMKVCMLRCSQILREQAPRSAMIQTIHDELIFDLCLEEDWSGTLCTLIQAMEHWPMFEQGGVPIRTSCELTTTTWENKRSVKVDTQNRTFQWAA